MASAASKSQIAPSSCRPKDEALRDKLGLPAQVPKKVIFMLCTRAIRLGVLGASDSLED